MAHGRPSSDASPSALDAPWLRGVKAARPTLQLHGLLAPWNDWPMARKTKAKQPNPPAPPPGTSVEWRKHGAALVERQGLSSTGIRERAGRNLFNRNATPEEAAYRAAIDMP